MPARLCWVERIYVHQAVSERFLDALARRLRTVRVGTEPGSTYGPMALPSQATVVAEQVRQAIEHGAGAPLGGAERVRGRIGEPIILVTPTNPAPRCKRKRSAPW